MSGIWADTIVLVSREVSGRDKYNNDVYADTRTTISGCSWQAVDTSERHDTGRDTTLTHYRVYIPRLMSATEVSAIDAVEYGDVEAEIHGDPIFNRSASGLLDHTVLPLREVDG